VGDGEIGLRAQSAAANLLRGALPGPGYFPAMVRGWQFPDVVRTIDQAIAYLSAFRQYLPASAPIQDDLSKAIGMLYDQRIDGAR